MQAVAYILHLTSTIFYVTARAQMTYQLTILPVVTDCHAEYIADAGFCIPALWKLPLLVNSYEMHGMSALAPKMAWTQGSMRPWDRKKQIHSTRLPWLIFLMPYHYVAVGSGLPS